MEHRPAIAVVTPSILTGLGLKAILEKIIPMAEVEVFGDVQELMETGEGHYFHFFVAAQSFIRHSAFFQACRSRTILLTNGRPQPEFAGMHSLNIFESEEELVRDIMRMHRGAHHDEHSVGTRPAQTGLLSARETEVVSLIARGYMNKEIAEKLHIGLTTVISHRRNLMEKLGIKSVSGLTIYAVTMGYVAPDEI